MSLVSIAHTHESPSDETPVEHQGPEVVDISPWVARTASLRRRFTGYVPRHRAEGPAE